MKKLLILKIFLGLIIGSALFSYGNEGGEKYLLRYSFRKGDVFKWDVTHQLMVHTIIKSTDEEVETYSRSTKLWTVKDITQEGNAIIEHKVTDVDMMRKQTGKEDSRYNSKTDTVVPYDYTDVSKNIGIPLSNITLNSNGELIKKQQLVPYITSMFDDDILIALPKDAVSIGETWKTSYELPVPVGKGMVKKVRAQRVFSLKSVKSDVATINFRTVILTPMADDPKLEAQLLDRTVEGTIRLDLKSGYLLSQQSDVDKRVQGFEGKASSIHNRLRLTEELID